MADVVATILSLPDDGGEPIIRVDYRLGNGFPINSGLTSPFTGPFTIVDGSNKNVQWRAVNSVDNDPDNWSDIKTVASSAPTLQASDSLTDRTLTVTVDAVTGVPTPVVTISGNVTFSGPDGGPWKYIAPSSENDFTVTWTVTATNGDLPDATVSGSELIPADILVPGTITPIVPPETQRTYDSQVFATMSDYSTWMAISNYTTDSGGQIVAPQSQTQESGGGAWTERDADYSLLEGQIPRVYVTDTAGSEYTFVFPAVEFEMLMSEVDYYPEGDVNDIVPAIEPIRIAFEGIETRYVTLNELNAAPVTLREIAYTGETVAGQTLLLVPPLTSRIADLGDATEVWSTTAANDIDVSDPAAPTLLIDAADSGAIDITCTTTQNSNSVVSEILGIPISSGAPGWVGPVWDDPTDTFTSDYTAATRYDWALYNDADGVPTVIDGVWTGTVAESGGGPTAATPINVTPTYPEGVSADMVTFAISNSSGTEYLNYTFTENVSGGDDGISDTTGSPTITSGISYDGKTGTTYDWMNDGTFTVEGSPVIYYLVVAGGGMGVSDTQRGGGGGAGGVVGGTVSDTFVGTDAEVYGVTVGAGAFDPNEFAQTYGEDSSITGTNAPAVALGGGSSGGRVPGYNGGSGGGGAGNNHAGGLGTPGQGNDGGAGAGDSSGVRSGGGGGGAGSAGQDAPADLEVGGNGGDGIQSSITGSAVYYAGGGGGGTDNNGTPGTGGLGGGGDGGEFGGNATAGTDGLGGGGGGGQTPGNNAAGGSGRVIIFVED